MGQERRRRVVQAPPGQGVVCLRPPLQVRCHLRRILRRSSSPTPRRSSSATQASRSCRRTWSSVRSAHVQFHMHPSEGWLPIVKAAAITVCTERVPADEDARDVHGLPFQGGEASMVLTLLLRIQLESHMCLLTPILGLGI